MFNKPNYTLYLAKTTNNVANYIILYVIHMAKYFFAVFISNFSAVALDYLDVAPDVVVFELELIIMGM